MVDYEKKYFFDASVKSKNEEKLRMLDVLLNYSDYLIKYKDDEAYNFSLMIDNLLSHEYDHFLYLYRNSLDKKIENVKERYKCYWFKEGLIKMLKNKEKLESMEDEDKKHYEYLVYFYDCFKELDDKIKLQIIKYYEETNGDV